MPRELFVDAVQASLQRRPPRGERAARRSLCGGSREPRISQSSQRGALNAPARTGWLRGRSEALGSRSTTGQLDRAAASCDADSDGAQRTRRPADPGVHR